MPSLDSKVGLRQTKVVENSRARDAEGCEAGAAGTEPSRRARSSPAGAHFFASLLREPGVGT